MYNEIHVHSIDVIHHSYNERRYHLSEKGYCNRKHFLSLSKKLVFVDSVFLKFIH